MSLGTKTAKSANVIWVEDNPKTVQGWVNSIKRHTNQRVNIEIAENSQGLEKAISEITANAFVFDIKLKGADGISLAKRIRRNNKIVPIRFVSTYLDQYKKRLEEVENVTGIHDRGELQDENFTKFWKGLAQDTESYQIYYDNGVNKMTWNEFLNSSKQQEIVYAHARLFTKLAISTMASRNWSWVAFCGESIVDGEKSLNKFPTFEEKRKLSEEFGYFAFVYSQTIVSEEGGEDGRLLNYYPKIQIKIQDREALADFDTGTNRTLVSDNLTNPEPGSIPHSAIHLGRPYTFFTNQRSISFHSYGDSDEFIGPFNVPVAIVEDWHGKESPWIVINPEREALIGRDIFAVDEITIQIFSTSELNVLTTISINKSKEQKNGS